MTVLLLPGDAPEDEWLACRRQGIGSSDVAPILRLSPYQGPLHVWLDKTGQYVWGGNAATKWGTRFEDDVLAEFIEHHPELEVIAKPGLFGRGEGLWQRASLDAEAWNEDSELELVEIKTGQGRWADFEAWGQPGTDEIPLHYLTQVTWACMVRGCLLWRLAFLPLDNLEGYTEYQGIYSPELAARLLAGVENFRTTYLLPGVEPEADGLADTRMLLDERRPLVRVEAELPADALLWRKGYRVNHEAIADATAAKEEYGNLLRQALIRAGATDGLVNGVPVATWRPDKNGKSTLKVKGL